MLIAMDEVSIREGEVQRMILRDCQGVGIGHRVNGDQRIPAPTSASVPIWRVRPGRTAQT